MSLTVKQENQNDLIIETEPGETVLAALAKAGLSPDAPCAGQGKCGKCLVEAAGTLSEATAAELKIGAGSGRRLACQARIEGPATVTLTARAAFSAIGGLGASVPYLADSPLKQRRLPLLDRRDATDSMAARRIGRAGLEALDQLARLDAGSQPGLAVMWRDELLNARPYPGDREEPELLAAALDLGTTGLSAALLDVRTHQVVAQGTALNPQVASGGDVISRISVASESAEKQARLQDLALEGLRDLLRTVAGDRLEHVWAAAISGNTTMLHLLAGVQPRGLAQAPYRPVFIRGRDLSALAGRLGLPAGAKFLCAPSISAYVGGDITSGLLAVELTRQPGTVLYIDIGTNGEIVLSREGRLVATSCAAGPALEGMNIICGQRATTGAVDSFTMNTDFTYEYTTLGGGPATGICGSGLIDLAAALVEAGLVHKTGRFMRPGSDHGQGWVQTLLDEGRFNFDRNGRIFLDQKDLRQVQLAKGAIAAAVEMLLARLNLTQDHLDEIIIAGSFGFHLKAESLKSIGLIPKTYQGPVRFVGNASLAGSARILLNSAAEHDLEELISRVEVVELGFEPEFQATFMSHLKF